MPPLRVAMVGTVRVRGPDRGSQSVHSCSGTDVGDALKHFARLRWHVGALPTVVLWESGGELTLRFNSNNNLCGDALTELCEVDGPSLGFCGEFHDVLCLVSTPFVYK